MAGCVLLPPLKVVPEGVVQESHVQMAELALALQYHEVADRLGLIDGHFLAVVLVAVACQPPHLGRNFGVSKPQDGDGKYGS